MRDGDRVTGQIAHSVFLSLFTYGPGQLDNFRHFEANLFLDDLHQGNISGSQIADVCDEWTAHCAPAGGQLTDAARDQIHQNVGVANFLHCFFREFSVQSANFRVFENEPSNLIGYHRNAI